ncbi:hypothetical protein YC2023_049801 [Brassica napus]
MKPLEERDKTSNLLRLPNPDESEEELRDLTRNVIAQDSIEVVNLVATAGIKLVLELHKCSNMVGTTTRKSSNKSEAWSQCSIYSIWRERNGRKHGETHQSSTSLLKFIDKGVRNRISSLRMGGCRKFSRAFEVWFDTRS